MKKHSMYESSNNHLIIVYEENNKFYCELYGANGLTIPTAMISDDTGVLKKLSEIANNKKDSLYLLKQNTRYDWICVNSV